LPSIAVMYFSDLFQRCQNQVDAQKKIMMKILSGCQSAEVIVKVLGLIFVN